VWWFIAYICNLQIHIYFDSASSENEYQEHFLGVKTAGTLDWRPHHLHVSNVMKIWEPKTPGILWATPGLLRDCFTFIYIYMYIYVYIYIYICIYICMYTYFFFFLTFTLLLILKVSRSHTTTHHSRYSSGGVLHVCIYIKKKCLVTSYLNFNNPAHMTCKTILKMYT
jgi:hypothetical protein